MMQIVIPLIALFILILFGILLFPSKESKRRIKNKKTSSNNNNTRFKEDNFTQDHPLTPPEREEMLDAVRNFSKNNPEKTAMALRKWIENEKVK